MNIEEIKDQIKANIKWETADKYPRRGGQSAGIMETKIILVSEELYFRIEIGYHRSQLRNKQLAYELFELTLDELIK